MVAIPGTKQRAKLKENARAVDVELSTSELEQLEAIARGAAWAGARAGTRTYGTSPRRA